MGEFEDESLKTKTFEDMQKIMRGETPEDIKEKCLKLCGEYLGGVWIGLTLEEIVVRRISGGYTNQLYYCGLAEGISVTSDEPKEVTVRFYGKKWFMRSENNERLSDMVIILLASEYNLGPKIYGIFNQGEIGEYIECHQFRTKDQNNPELVKELSRKLAQFHSLDVPLAQDSNWFKNYLDDFYEKAYKESPIDDILREIKAVNFTKTNLREEYEWLLKCIEAINSPIVFSHNDFRGSNVLVHDIIDDKNPRVITLCDFEYSCYYYRGFDLGVSLDEFGRTHMSEWKHFASDQIIESFLRGYLDEMIEINGEEFALNQQNSINQMIKETKVFSLAAKMFIILFLFQARELPFSSNKNDILTGADNMFGYYLESKAQFEREGILPSI